MAVAWESLCRLCASFVNCNTCLFSDDGEKKGILHFIEKFLSITISPVDGLPTKVCEDCSNKVIEFQDYANQCERIQSFFKKYNQGTIELKNEEQLKGIKSEFIFAVQSVEIKTEIQDEAVYNCDPDDFIDDDMDYLPLSDLMDTKKDIGNVEVKSPKKKRGRKKKNVELKKEYSEINEKEIFTDLNNLLPDAKTEEELNSSNKNESKKESKPKINKTKTSKSRQISKMMVKSQYGIFKFNCHVCEKESPNWNALKKHVKVTHKCTPKVMCICLKYLSTHKSLLHHFAKHNPEKGFQCTSCDKSYGYKRDLDKHMNQHIPKDQLPFVCCKCGKHFATARILKVHEYTHRPREERFTFACDSCDLKFSSKGSLVNHKRVIHDKVKPFICDLCGHASSTKANMEEHRTRHLDVVNFVCNECKKGFKTKGSLVRHIDTHGDTAYQCPHCPMLLNSRRTLRNHLFVHDRTASQVCSFCGKAFKRRKELKSHLKLHTGERPYSCPWCPRSFTNGSNCRIHKRRMHPQEFALEETTNPFAPSNAAKPGPKKIIHASFKDPSIDKLTFIKNNSISPNNDDKNDDLVPMEDEN